MDPPSISLATAGGNHPHHQSYPDSANSSPRSHHTDTWDEPLPPVPGAKLRLVCSYGGHIVPRPHDKSLCYVGGETRIVVADRRSSFADLHSRLSQTLLNGRQFALKYQLPKEDLDSLVSVTTDEDLENMVEEYDRISSSAPPLKPSRLRLFLFPSKPEIAASMGCLLDDAKSETWFVDVLNGAGLLPRGLSDSAAMDDLLEIDDGNRGDFSEGQNKPLMNNNVNQQEVQSTLSDSPMVETGSSFESGVSSPSMANLPPIKVRVDEANNNARMGGLDEQFSQMSVATLNSCNIDDRSIPLTNPAVVGVNSDAAVGGENIGRVIFEDEKSDHGARKPPLPLQQPVPKKFGDTTNNLPSPDSKQTAGHNLPSPDSVASDSSIASLPKQTAYQDATFATATRENRVPGAVVDPMRSLADPSPQIQMQQAHESMILPPSQQSQLQQQPPPLQFVQAGGHYIQHPATGQVPISSYYQVYAPPQQQAALHQQMDQQYPMYFLPVTQTQPYNLIMQSNIVDSTSAPNATFVPSTAYKEISPPIYPTKATTPQPEMLPNLYRTTGTATPTLVQVPHSQFQQQYFGLSHMPPPSQSIPAGSAPATSYAYDYAHHAHDHAYYAQHPAAATLPQYQTMAPGSAVMLAQTSSPLTPDDTTQQ